MKITYTDNPLSIITVPSKKEIEIMRRGIVIRKLEGLLFDAWTRLQIDNYYDIEKAKQKLNPENYCSDEFDHSIEDTLEWCLQELQDEHIGDCTSFPASCSKCYAESLLGINTISGLDKSAAYYIQYAFGGQGQGCETINDAIIYLQNYNPQADEDYDHDRDGKYAERWKISATRASEWLVRYKARKRNGRNG